MIIINKVSISFEDEQVFKDFSLLVKRGEKLAITGESGKGKSTLMNLLCGFIPDFEGEVFIDDLEMNPKNICAIRKKIAWLPQETALKLMSVKELFYTPFSFALNKANKPTKEQISEIFSAFSLDEALLEKKLKEISGGQKQRIILASCILQKKALILLDEPSSALDKKIKKRVSDYILGLKETTIIAVTHDDYWMNSSNRVLHLGEEK
ncbi:MAG: ABC transporter ATP-binding protein [Candidatus Neomarinimicrobiota bacterium]|jgi:ABC-type bacteriocin/lantibiotic exporter with double-glycine peptidase domain